MDFIGFSFHATFHPFVLSFLVFGVLVIWFCAFDHLAQSAYSDGASSASLPETFKEALIVVHDSTSQSGDYVTYTFFITYEYYILANKKLTLPAGYFYASDNNARVIVNINNGTVTVVKTINSGTSASINHIYVYAR